MANMRLSMRKIQEILLLCWLNGLSARQAAKSCGVGRTTIREYLDRAERAGLSWPLPEGLDETALEHLLFPSATPVDTEQQNMPPFDYIHTELKRKHVTLQFLWHEYREEQRPTNLLFRLSEAAPETGGDWNLMARLLSELHVQSAKRREERVSHMAPL